jgi:acyl-CoA synthetase (AMP-forming)/AMP-acid ligase II
MNIVDPILFQCAMQPKAPALCSPGLGANLISYGRLGQHIHNLCRRILKLGLRPGTVAVLVIEDPIFHATMTLALTRLGIVTVSRYDERVLDAVQVDVVIADKYPGSARIEQVVLVDLSWTRGDGEPLGPDELPQTSEDDACRIVLTSGSTGDPKAISFSHNMLADRIARHQIVLGSRLPTCSRIYSDLPVSTAFGFRFLFFTLWRGGTFFLPGANFEATVSAFEEHRVQCWLSSPGGLENLIKGYERFPLLDSEIETVIVPGDRLPRALADEVRRRICPHVMSVYGATETTTTACAPVHMLGDDPDGVGYLVPGVTVEIVDDNGSVVPRNSEGLIRVRSRYAVTGYVGDPVASAKSFRDGWFYPGDIGVLDTNNFLRIVGRQDNVLNLGGDKINPETIERALAIHAGVAECAAFGVPNERGIDEIWVVVAADPKVVDQTLKEHCAATLPPQFRPAGFLRVDRLPRNPMGKIDRAQLPKLLK